MPLAGFEQLHRYAELVHRVFGEDVEFLPPGLILELDRPEWKKLKSEAILTSDINQVAVAAQFAHVGIRNGVGSNVIIVVTKVFFRPGSDTGVETHIYDGNIGLQLTGLTAGWPRDTRNRADTGDGVGRVGVKSGAIVGNTIFTWWVNKTGAVGDKGAVPFPLEYVLGPGSELVWVTQTVNSSLSASIEWYERRLRPEEIGE